MTGLRFKLKLDSGNFVPLTMMHCSYLSKPFFSWVGSSRNNHDREWFPHGVKSKKRKWSLKELKWILKQSYFPMHCHRESKWVWMNRSIMIIWSFFKSEKKVMANSFMKWTRRKPQYEWVDEVLALRVQGAMTVARGSSWLLSVEGVFLLPYRALLLILEEQINEISKITEQTIKTWNTEDNEGKFRV